MTVMVKIIAKLMSRYGLSKGANIAKNMGFKSKSIQEAGKNTIKKNIGKGGWKNRLTPEQTSVMRDAARREKRRIEEYERDMREDIKRYGTPMQEDWDEYMRSLNEEFAYLKNRKGEF